MQEIEQVIDSLDIAAKSYPLKALAPEIGKGESTLRNELSGQPGYKLGLLTALLIMKKTGDLAALDRIERMFGRVAFVLPRPERLNPAPLMRLVANVTKEFGGQLEAFSRALDDGVMTASEARECLKELLELVEACIQLQAYLEPLAEPGSK